MGDLVDEDMAHQPVKLDVAALDPFLEDRPAEEPHGIGAGGLVEHRLLGERHAVVEARELERVLDLHFVEDVVGGEIDHAHQQAVAGPAHFRRQSVKRIGREQIEIGVKHRLAGTGFQWNVALFDITKNNLVEDNPNSANPDDLIVVPEQTSQGIEVGFSYTASDVLQFHGNAAVLNAETSTGTNILATATAS